MMPVAPNELTPPIDSSTDTAISVASSRVPLAIRSCIFGFNQWSWAFGNVPQDSSTLLSFDRPPAPAVPSMWPKLPFRETIEIDANTPANELISTGSPRDVPVPWASMTHVFMSPAWRIKCYYDDPLSAVKVALCPLWRQLEPR